MADDFRNRTYFEIPVAAFEGFELTHFIRDLDPVSEILIFHYLLLSQLATVIKEAKLTAFSTLAKFVPGIKQGKFCSHREYELKTTIYHVTERTVSGKLKSLDELAEIAGRARKNGKTVVFTNGCFDLLHRGHVHVLRQAKAAGDLLIVALNSDRSVKAIKGSNRPVLAESDRIELISAMEMVDYVLVFDEPDPYRVIAAIKPDVLAKGGDWSAEKIVGADIVEQTGGRVMVIPYMPGFSTSEIIERIKN
jgi:D-beta-D-heptose 7-phosphate kinase/D-beta-D-heptose 1-phosphate adenosyltransferase